MNKAKLVKLFSGLCCNVCRHDFDEDAIIIKRQEKDLLVLNIICSECGKNFGVAFLGIENLSLKNSDDELVIKDCPEPISYDDVLDAHKFIEKLDKDWKKYIPENLKNT